MGTAKKAARLEMLRKIGEERRGREELAFGGLPVTREEICEAVRDMDTFREEQRQNRGEALTSDEA